MRIVAVADTHTFEKGLGILPEGEFGGWAYNLPRGAALAEKWALIPNSCDVLITHGPPHGIGDRSGMSVMDLTLDPSAVRAVSVPVRDPLHPD